MDSMLIAKNGGIESRLLPKFANRHGLITGATGTGKTVTLQRLAEEFSAIGVPVFMADIKGDLSGIAQPGGGNAKIEERAKALNIKISYRANHVELWDVFGEQGTPIRTTVSDIGPLLLARLLELNDTQEGVLNIAFKIADDEGLLLLDLKDLRSLLTYVAENAKQFSTDYGNIAAATVGTVQRSILTLEQQGGAHLFGEPALNIQDLMRVENGCGTINILAADKLIISPRVYATFLLALLSELFEELPEVGDLDKPKLVFFFDEAHLLFTDAPKALLTKIEQVVRLIRSKGVGIYFVTQNPLDVPETVLGQLGNRVQHALRAFTPRDQKAVKTAASTFRPNPKLNTEQVITELTVGEALVSFLDAKGAPTMVERVFIVPPGSRLGVLTTSERASILSKSKFNAQYSRTVDNESAHEILKARAAKKLDIKEEKPAKAQAGSRRQTAGEALFKSAARSIGTQIGGALIRGILGALTRKR